MNDPLSINLSTTGIDTTIPLLPDGDYPCKVLESSIDPNKDTTGFNWNLKLGVQQTVRCADGRETKLDHPLFVVVGLQPAKEAKDSEGYLRQVAAAQDAIFGTTKENRPNFTPALSQQAVGRSIIATTGVDEYPKGSGNRKNQVVRMKPAPATL